MNILVIGDVHGCYHTLKSLVEEHWSPQREILVQIGDLINKGPHSVACIDYWRSLEVEYGTDQVVMLRGNHEQSFVNERLEYPKSPENAALKKALLEKGKDPENVRQWFSTLPLSWENDDLLITHAGLAKKGKKLISTENRNGVLYNKGPLKRLSQVQVKGHSIVTGDKPVFVPRENAWYIDTGAWTKKYLSAICFSEEGDMLRVVRVKTASEDKPPKRNKSVLI